MLQDTGILSLVSTIASDLNKGQFGSDATPVTSADGGVLTPIAASLIALSSVTTNGRSISAKHVVNSITANSTTFAEHEVTLTDDTSFTRNIFTPFTKTSSIEVNAFTIFTIVPVN